MESIDSLINESEEVRELKHSILSPLDPNQPAIGDCVHRAYPCPLHQKASHSLWLFG